MFVPDLGFGEALFEQGRIKELSRVAGGGPDTVPPSVERKQRPAPTARIISTRSLTGSWSVTSMNAPVSASCAATAVDMPTKGTCGCVTITRRISRRAASVATRRDSPGCR